MPRFKVMLEAAGCLACFKGVIDNPTVFLGTGNCTHVRLYFARSASEQESKETFVRPRSVSLSREIQEIAATPIISKRNRINSKGSTPAQETVPVQTIIKEVFSDRITCLDTFLQLAVILWRIRIYRYVNTNNDVKRLTLLQKTKF